MHTRRFGRSMDSSACMLALALEGAKVSNIGNARLTLDPFRKARRSPVCFISQNLLLFSRWTNGTANLCGNSLKQGVYLIYRSVSNSASLPIFKVHCEFNKSSQQFTSRKTGATQEFAGPETSYSCLLSKRRDSISAGQRELDTLGKEGSVNNCP